MLSSRTGITVPTIFGSIPLAPFQQVADKRAAARLGVGQVFVDRVREVRHGHRLQPNSPGSGQRGKEYSVTTEESVLDARDRGDVELHRLLVHPDVARVHAQRVARLEVVDDDLAVELHPGLTLALQALHAEARTAKDAGAEPLLKADRELHAGGGADEPMSMDHVAP